MTPNLRDIGHLPACDGRVVAPHRVLRSAVPAADDVGPEGLTWPPAVVIDLRSPGESEAVHPLAGHGARVVNLPLLSALRPGAAPVDTLHALYLVMLDEASAHLVELVREVGTASGTILIHCAAGKDRTGVSIALLLRLIGVPRRHVVDDYLLTAQAEQIDGIGRKAESDCQQEPDIRRQNRPSRTIRLPCSEVAVYLRLAANPRVAVI